MGQWGYYDHESDSVQDKWEEFGECYSIFKDECNQTEFWKMVTLFAKSLTAAEFVGFLIYAVDFANKKRQVVNDKKIYRSHLPTRLPQDFPDNLRALATMYCSRLLQVEDVGWKNYSMRRKALLREQVLFSPKCINCSAPICD